MSTLQFRNKLAIATVSLGQHVSHTLPEKIAAASRNHFSGVEIVCSDLEVWSVSQSLNLISAANAIRALCQTHNLTILSLAPFKNFESHTSPLSTRLETARSWLETAQALGALFLQVPSQFDTPNCVEDEEIAVRELQALADLAAGFGISIAYEAVAWGTYVATWQDSFRIIKKVDRVNFGMCWDAFHVIARIWGSCTSSTGKLEDADEELKSSLKDFVSVLKENKGKVFYVQLSDAEFYDPPLWEGHRFWVDGMDQRLIWSRNTRPFPLETQLGGYFPIGDIIRAVLRDGNFEGWVSFEVFDWRMRDEKALLEHAAARGWKSWVELNKRKKEKPSELREGGAYWQ